MKTSISIPETNLTIPISGRDHIQGPIDAPIQLLEYGDFQCPFCGQTHPVIKAIQQRLGDRLCFAFRHFPLTNMHPNAEHAAHAAEAAGAQRKFWQMHDLLFENQYALDDDDLARYASMLGLDASRLMSQVMGGVYSGRVREDFRSGVRSGVNGTPTLFINGIRYDGERGLEVMLGALARAGK
jgi:protein-disulfide isomerase